MAAKKAAKKAPARKKASAKPAQKTVQKKAAKKAGPTSKRTATPAAAPGNDKVRKVKTPFNKKELVHYRDLLLECRDRLLSNVTAMEAEALKSSGQDFSVDHMADHGSDNFDQDFTLSLVETERRELTEIHEALKRIEAKTYGICEGTFEPIGEPRLEAIPYTRYVVEYQRRVEAGEIDEDEIPGRA
ncbi:MAG: TraR/DksA family transcriptional regulator [Planctomycetota bacterium]